MKRDIQFAHLQEAERHVATGERHIVEQERRIADLDRDGHDTTQARALLETFRTLQAEHVAHRDHILRELEA
jgi:ferritin